jgi:hypothetical protein
MLTQEQLAILKNIYAGNVSPDDMRATMLLERGLVSRQKGGPLRVTPAGRRALGLVEAYGDTVLDAILPGEGSRQATEEEYKDR